MTTMEYSCQNTFVNLRSAEDLENLKVKRSRSMSWCEACLDFSPDSMSFDSLSPKDSSSYDSRYLSRFSIESEFSASVADELTSIIIRNIPHGYTQEDLFNEVTSANVRFNFLCLISLRKSNTKRNPGFAFVNFASEEDAIKFRSIFNNYAWNNPAKCRENARVDFAERQGFRNHVAHNNEHNAGGVLPYIDLYLSGSQVPYCEGSCPIVYNYVLKSIY
jgi:RNA recognition motif-containing protein